MEVVILLSAQRQAFPCLGDVQQHDPLIGRQARVRHLGARPANAKYSLCLFKNSS